MSLTREQYDRIMLGYTRTQARHRQELLRRREEIYRHIPEYESLDREVSGSAVAELQKRLAQPADADLPGIRPDRPDHSDGTVSSSVPADTARQADIYVQTRRSVPRTPASGRELRHKLSEISMRKKSLLKSHGYPEDYLEPVYDCPFCHDTGFVGNEKCRCFKRQEIALLYDQSHLEELAKTENFEHLSEKYYTGSDLVHFRNARDLCLRFVSGFGKTADNLYFYGTVGTGKSFLSICIAHDLIEKGYSVLYFSAASLFETLAGYSFRHGMQEEYRSFTSDLYGCDLLIIDDLGTELTNAFVSAQLFNCINERILGRKSTVISTNLSLAQFQSRYSDRIFSRIMSHYKMCKLTGPDIRLLKRRAGGGA